MTEAAKSVLEQALALPPEKRAWVAGRLLASLDPSEQHRVDELWIEEAKARLAAYKRGETQAIPADEALAELRRKHGCQKEQP